MRLRTLAIALWFVTGLVGPCQAQEVAHQEPSVELPAELGRVLTDYETAWRRGDAAGARSRTPPKARRTGCRHVHPHIAEGA